jgi:hypothetical protein
LNKPASKYQYTVQDTLNGLTITWQGRKRWIEVLLYLGGFCYMGYHVIIYLVKLLSIQSLTINANPAVILVGIPAMVIFLYVCFTEGFQGLFNMEQVIINAETIQVSKSGLGSFTLKKTFFTNGKMCFFHITGLLLAFYKSKQMAKIYSKGFLKPTAIHPMRRCFYGISKQDAIAILEKIKARYPQYDIYYRGYDEDEV